MDYADETYVRKYTRKTLTWKLLGWEGRAVKDAMLGEFDAAGIFEIRGDAAQCIAAVTDIPLEVARVGLARLLETETWVVTARSITWPTYEEAQNCRRSDRIRQRESRRARSVQSVTNGHTPSQCSVTDVTGCHNESHDVTLPPSSPSASPLPPSRPTERDPERAPEAPPPSVPGLTRVASPEPSSGTPTTRRLPRDWTPTAALYAEAWAAGVPNECLDEDVTYWRSRDLGADVFGDGIEDFFRAHFPRLKKRAETERFKAAQSARAGPKRHGSAQEDHGYDPFAKFEESKPCP